MTEVKIFEDRLLELQLKEKELDLLLATYPELKSGQKLTPAAKRYKEALAKFVNRVEVVLGSEQMLGLFQIAAVHGFQYSGPNLASDIQEAKNLIEK